MWKVSDSGDDSIFCNRCPSCILPPLVVALLEIVRMQEASNPTLGCIPLNDGTPRDDGLDHQLVILPTRLQ